MGDELWFPCETVDIDGNCPAIKMAIGCCWFGPDAMLKPQLQQVLDPELLKVNEVGYIARKLVARRLRRATDKINDVIKWTKDNPKFGLKLSLGMDPKGQMGMPYFVLAKEHGTTKKHGIPSMRHHT